jgi:hypothetical protein
MISLKEQITNLVCFFNALTVTIKVTANVHVTPFLKTVQALVSDGSSDSDNFKIADYTLTDLQRTVCLPYFICLHAPYVFITHRQTLLSFAFVTFADG